MFVDLLIVNTEDERKPIHTQNKIEMGGWDREWPYKPLNITVNKKTKKLYLNILDLKFVVLFILRNIFINQKSKQSDRIIIPRRPIF